MEAMLHGVACSDAGGTSPAASAWLLAGGPATREPPRGPPGQLRNRRGQWWSADTPPFSKRNGRKSACWTDRGSVKEVPFGTEPFGARLGDVTGLESAAAVPRERCPRRVAPRIPEARRWRKSMAGNLNLWSRYPRLNARHSPYLDAIEPNIQIAAPLDAEREKLSRRPQLLWKTLCKLGPNSSWIGLTATDRTGAWVKLLSPVVSTRSRGKLLMVNYLRKCALWSPVLSANRTARETQVVVTRAVMFLGFARSRPTGSSATVKTLSGDGSTSRLATEKTSNGPATRLPRATISTSVIFFADRFAVTWGLDVLCTTFKQPSKYDLVGLSRLAPAPPPAAVKAATGGRGSGEWWRGVARIAASTRCRSASLPLPPRLSSFAGSDASLANYSGRLRRGRLGQAARTATHYILPLQIAKERVAADPAAAGRDCTLYVHYLSSAAQQIVFRCPATTTCRGCRSQGSPERWTAISHGSDSSFKPEAWAQGPRRKRRGWRGKGHEWPSETGLAESG